MIKEDISTEDISKMLEEMEYDGAKVVLEIKLKSNPDNVELLDLYSELLIAIEEFETAKAVLKRSIALEPDKNPEKFMSMGQLTKKSHKALKYYQKGLELYLQEFKETNDEKRVEGLKSLIAIGYAAVGELYMTTMLCDEEKAEETCENFILEALTYDPNSFDALIQLSNLRILRKRDSEALDCMNKIYDSIIETEESGGDTFPSAGLLNNLAKNYSELENYSRAIRIYKILVKLNDENFENWYLLAFNHYQIKNFKSSCKALESLFILFENTYEKDKEIEEAAKELFEELEKIRKTNKTGELTNNQLDEELDLSNGEENINNKSSDMYID